MKVYHSSTQRIENPDTFHSRDYLDFGKGFYVTTIEEQAVKYAERFIRRGLDAWLNVYELSDDVFRFKTLTLKSYDESWLDFITSCRTGNDRSEYDIITGGIANDKIFRTIDLYFAGDINKDEVLKRLAYEKPNNQICIRSQQVIDNCLTFIESIKI